MDLPQTLLLELWRAACRYPWLEHALPRMGAALAGRIPLSSLHVAIQEGRGRETEVHAAREKTGGGAWESWPEGGREAVAHLVPSGEDGARRGLVGVGEVVVATPVGARAVLDVGDGVSGAILLTFRQGASVDDGRLRLLETVLEPFSVAVRNHRRMARLDIRRAAAEADKASVLRRLDRDDILDTIVGESGGLRGVMERVGLVARSDMPVLLFGETGSGKEVIARALHGQSLRAQGPFIRVNCAAIAPELIDSELFGHEKGAFTGAIARRRGWFERAHRGTLLLDEIGELPLPAQVRLLRVLQEGAFERVGGEHSVRVDVRVVAATHADLPAMVQNRRFREDLWYRVAGFQIILPPLRERREDIPDLARYFLARASRHFGLRPLELTSEDLVLLTSYHWQGNVRELATVMDRAAILGAGRTLEVAKALGPFSFAGPGDAGDRERGTGADAAPLGRGRVATLDDAMREHVEKALAATRGQIEGERGAARLLGVNPHTLRARLRRLGVDWARFRS